MSFTLCKLYVAIYVGRLGLATCSYRARVRLGDVDDIIRSVVTRYLCHLP